MPKPPTRADLMAIAVANLGAADDAHALTAARWIAAEIAAAGAKPNAVASGLLVMLDKIAAPPIARPFAELGPRATRKRLVVVSRLRDLPAEDKGRVMALRARLSEDPHARLQSEEIGWLDGLVQGFPASTPGRPRASAQ